MSNLQKFFQNTGLKPYDGELGVNVLCLQYEHLRKHIPLLYLTICFYFILAVVFIANEVNADNLGGKMASYILPIIVIPLALIRAIIWHRRRNDPFASLRGLGRFASSMFDGYTPLTTGAIE